MPKLSVITVNYNNCKGLLKTIQSVIAQTKRDFEFIIIDGGSTDGSAELIEQHRRDLTYGLSEKDNGIYEAMNKGVSKAQGEYLLFLNSGDWLNNITVFEKAERFLSGADVISGDINVFDKNKWSVLTSQDVISVTHFLSVSLFHQATFIKKELFIKSGLYDESFKSCGDYEFFIRTLLVEDASYQHIPLLISDFIADGISNNKAFDEINFKEREKAWNKHFSQLVVQHFIRSKEVLYSKELKWGNRFFRFFPFAKIIDKLLAKVWY